MPHQIPFTVVFSSGEEERHPASELNRHEPTVRGWQSARNCKYPQELVLRLQRPSAIRRVQVLAHQCLIPERIELWVGTEDSWRGGAPGAAAGASAAASCTPTPSHQNGDAAEDGAKEDDDRDKDEADADATPFQYLGFITLSDNQGTGFKSRELKSVSVPPCAGSFLKIRLHRNHANQYNRYNQVGLIAVNILGDETDAVTASNGRLTSPASDGPGQGQNQKGDSLSLYDDLAFQMYVDQDAARIIREMEARKVIGVKDERFEYARKLKAAQAQLHAAGERLARMTLDKRAAIAAEDYGRARTLKTTIDQLRERLYKELAVDDLLERDGPVARNDDPPDEETQDAVDTVHAAQGRRAEADGANLEAERDAVEAATSEPRPLPSSPMHCGLGAPSPTPTTPARTSGLPRPVVNPPAKEAPPAVRGGVAAASAAQRRRMKSAPATPVSALSGASSAHATASSAAGSGAPGSCTPTARSSYEAYEERALPALRHGPSPEQDHHADRPRSKLNERERKQAALPISVFGVEMVEKFYSKHFADKEEGLRRLRAELCDEGRATPQPNKKARAAFFLLHRALRDKVFSVYSLAAEVIRLFFTHFVPDRVSPEEVARSVDRLLPELLLKSGDSTPRVRNMAVHTILSIADVEQVRSLNVIPATLTRPLQAATHPRLALSRLEMVEQLILSHGISQPGTGGSRGSSGSTGRGRIGGGGSASHAASGGSGMTCRTLAELGAQGLQHPAEPVRKVAERILVLVYRTNPRLVRKQLPPDDDITRRNLLYRQLFTDFDTIDVQRKREMQERQREESSGSGSPAPHKGQGGWVPPSAMSASWHQGQAGGLGGLGAASLSPAPSPRPGLRRHAAAAALSSSMSAASMSASWTNGSSAKGGGSSSSSSGASSLASPTAEAPSSAQRRPADGDGDVKACDFCGVLSESFASDEGLNSHYWRACPLLTRCNECQQVVEIACLATHLTEECELRALYRRCGGCTEAVPLQRMQLHVSSCVPLGAQSRRCPLCHSDVRDTEAAWRSHLMGPTAKLCAAHPRLKYARAVRAPAPNPAPAAPPAAP